MNRFHYGFLVSASLIAVSVQAQNPPAAAVSDQPAIKSEVRIVVVDVVVTQGKGEPVSGLHKEDFQVTENGRPQTISFFEEHKGGVATPLALLPMPPDVFNNFPTVKTTDSVNVLLLDSLNTQAIDQQYVHAQMIRYLENALPGSRVAIFTLGSRLRMVRGMTADSSELLVALQDQKSGTDPRVLRQLSTPAQVASDDLMIDSQRSPEGKEAIREFLAEERGQQGGDRVWITLQAFQQLARYLSPMPGRKNLMWVSGSFPLNFFPDVGPRRAFPKRYASDIRQTADLLTAEQVAVYPISATGLNGDTAYDPNNYGKAIHDGYSDRGFEQIAMETLARDTGGTAFYNTNNLSEAMTEAIDNGSHYYTLTYTPSNAKMDGKFRNIELKTVNGGYALAYRHGYYAEDAKIEHGSEQGTQTDPLLPLIGFGMPDFSQVLYKVRVAPSEPQPGPNAARAGINADLQGAIIRYGLDFAISPKDVRLETSHGGVRQGRIEVTIVGYGVDGKPLNLMTKEIPIHLEPEVYKALQQVGYQLHEEIDLPTGEVYLRTGIYDLNSGSAGTLGIPLNVAGLREETVPAQCATADFSKLGRPMMLEQPETLWPHGDLQFGLSVAEERIPLGKPTMLHLWINNPGDKVEQISSCMTLDFFWSQDFDLYDAYGHRLLRKKQWEPQGKPGPDVEEKANQVCLGSWLCTRNFAIPIPAHTCLNGAANPAGYDFNRDLLMYYDLPPGMYYVVPRTSKMDAKNCREVAPKLDPAALRDKLRISIEQN